MKRNFKKHSEQIIIGLAGLHGAGKSQVGVILTSNGFKHYSVREFALKFIKKKGLVFNRETLASTCNELRSKKPHFIIEELYKRAIKSGENSVIESIGTLGEVDFIKKQKNFFLVGIKAPRKIRFSRIKKRKSGTDNIDYKSFLKHEKIETSSDPSKQNLPACIRLSDFIISNNYTIKVLEKKTQELIKKLEN